MKKYNKKGFTLIELLSVVAILSILVVLALPNVIDALNKSRRNTFLTEAKTVYRSAADKYMSQALIGNRISAKEGLQSEVPLLSYTVMIIRRQTLYFRIYACFCMAQMV